MKKIILALLFVLFIGKASFAATTIDFIYINGSNTNDDKAYENFIKGINKFHPVLKSHLEKDAFTYEHILKNGNYVLEEKPSNYFWGYKSQEDLTSMKERATLLQSVSPWIAYAFRNMLAGMLHDAIWVRNTYNMMPILDELNKQVQNDIKAGKKVVLLGYSAGTFITMEYMASRVAFVNLNNWFSHSNLSTDLKKMMQQNPNKKTCASALLRSKMLRLTPLGTVEINNNKEEFKKAYMSIEKETAQYCIPENSIVGVINYASPIPLFYSDISNPKYDTTRLLNLMYKYVIEHDTFFLTVNFADDPLGYPNGVNYKNKEISEYLNVKFKAENGFFYDYSSDLSWRTVVGAHTCYWNAKERFAKAIVKAYKEGYNNQYCPTQEKK